ncbi:MAG TPA: response regulator [Flavisolibacter sp.]|nr:response regulator [Flavisolibacter sp.]
MNIQHQTLTKSPRILFVEDDIDDRDIIEDSLERLNWHHRLLFSDGGQLLQWLKSQPQTQPPAMLVLDNQLPNYRGETLLRTLKKDPIYANVPVMIFSSSISEKKKAALLASGAWKVEEKPSTIKAYDQLMQELITFVSHSS